MPQVIDILTYLVFLLLHFFVFLFNYLLWNRKLFQPAVLFSLVWLVILIVHLFFRVTILDELGSLSLRLHFIFLAGTVFFSLGGVLIYIYNKQIGIYKKVEIAVPTEINRWFKLSLVSIIFLGLPLYIQASYKIFLASQAENFFTGLRGELVYGQADIGPLKYLMSLSFVTYAITLYDYYNKRNRFNLNLLIISLLILIGYAIFSTGRTYFFLILTIYLGIGLFVNKKFSIKRYSLAFAFFIITFISIGAIYGKGASTYYSTKENIEEVGENLGIYLVTSLNALDIELNDNTGLKTNGENTLRLFIKIGMSLGLIPEKQMANLAQDFVYVPYATNVYTYYSPYIKDFGLGYAYLILFLIGTFHAWLHNMAITTYKIRYIFYYAFLLFPLFLSFFADEYLTLLSFWLQLFFLTEVLFSLNMIANLLSKRDGKSEVKTSAANQL